MSLVTRLGIKAAIRRAMAGARADLETLDAASRAEVEAMYRNAVADLSRQLDEYTDDAGNLRAEVLARMLGRATERIDQLGTARNAALTRSILAGAALGAAPWAQDAGVGIDIGSLAEDAARFVRNFVARDGLQLSDRLWRLDRGARQAVEEQLESAVLQGESASRAARDFLARGESIPGDVARKIDAARADRVKRSLGAQLLRNDDSAYSHALRVMRTEINRAHGEAFRAGMQRHPQVIGERFVLSPAHPQVDVCDFHANANLHGLGPGVYPVGRSPWPAHPNTLSYLEPVFRDEISSADRAGKSDPITYLKAQPPGYQESVLGRAKAQLLRADNLRTNEIETPWRVLKKRKNLD